MAHADFKEGFGVTGPKGLNVRTVSDTRRAAIINWLMTTSGVMLLSSHSDDQVNAMWDAYRGDYMVRPVRIYVQ